MSHVQAQRVRRAFPFSVTNPDNADTPDSVGWHFEPSALLGLAAHDQERFVAYGQGVRQVPSYSQLVAAFEAQVRAHGDASAIEHAGECISYAELHRQANRLAACLVQSGVTPGARVGLLVQRGIPMVVGIVAALKVGAAYVPQCIGIAPPAQMRHVLEAAQADVVLTTTGWLNDIPALPAQKCIAIDALMAEPMPNPAAYDSFISERPITADDLCFVLFTSGTTGKPNGVMVTHGNVCNIVLTQPGDLGLQPGMKVAQLLNIAFDMAAWEVLGALTHGATLVVRGADFQAVAEQVDVIIATPSILATIDASRCPQVRTVAVAGEPCPRPLADKWAAQCTFYNACGPTEVTIVNTMQHHKPHYPALSIGKPTPNNTVYVLDDKLQPCAMGEVGVMWAGGACVSKGYIGNAALTAERYAPDPFLGQGHMMFNTRDLGRWMADGTLEHLGRVDDQVKVRGFRVELDSVSCLLEQAPGCTHAVTLKLNDRDLVAFVCPQSSDIEAGRALIAQKLPYYCMPAMVIAMAELPMTDRGKVDKRALLALAETHQLRAQHEAAGVSA